MKCGDLLFVYGTLRPGQRAWPYIKNQVEIIKETSIQDAKMYNIGSYPGVVSSDSNLDRVYGTLLRITDEEVSSFLDRYEGCPFLFDRLVVKTSCGEDAWVYFYIYGNPKENTRILSGDWIKK